MRTMNKPKATNNFERGFNVMQKHISPRLYILIQEDLSAIMLLTFMILIAFYFGTLLVSNIYCSQKDEPKSDIIGTNNEKKYIKG